MQFDSCLREAVLVFRGLSSEWAESAASTLVMAMSGVTPAGLTSTHVAAGTVETRTVKESSQIFHRLRGETTCTEHTVAVILSHKLGYRGMLVIKKLIAPTREAHGSAMVDSKTPSSASNRRVVDSLGGWVDELKEIAALTQCKQ